MKEKMVWKHYLDNRELIDEMFEREDWQMLRKVLDAFVDAIAVRDLQINQLSRIIKNMAKEEK